MQEVFYCLSHCDIDKALRLISQEDEKNGTSKTYFF